MYQKEIVPGKGIPIEDCPIAMQVCYPSCFFWRDGKCTYEKVMNGADIPEAKCPKCGARYFGWALRDPRHRICKKCGAKLKIVNKKKRKSRS